MKLQVNFNGAWRDVVAFDAAELVPVAEAAARIKGSAKPSVELSIVDDAGKRFYFNAVRTDGTGRWHDANAWPMPGLPS
jgi:hypothetical protein